MDTWADDRSSYTNHVCHLTLIDARVLHGLKIDSNKRVKAQLSLCPFINQTYILLQKAIDALLDCGLLFHGRIKTQRFSAKFQEVAACVLGNLGNESHCDLDTRPRNNVSKTLRNTLRHAVPNLFSKSRIFSNVIKTITDSFDLLVERIQTALYTSTKSHVTKRRNESCELQGRCVKLRSDGVIQRRHTFFDKTR